MPLYNIEHSYPLNVSQKVDLAERITKLHAHTFTTPSIFVQVKFHQQDATAGNIFVAGKPVENVANRIIAYVRGSSSRTKEHFDKLGEKIENAWYVAIGERADGDEEEVQERFQKQLKGVSESERQAKMLLSVAFVTGIVVREKGYVIPEAGQEADWIKQHRKEFENKADLGDQGWKDMLEEIEKRDDLKEWRE